MSNEADLLMYFGTTPVMIVPVSDRAKAFYNLPEGVGGLMILGEVDEVMGSIPPDYRMAPSEQYPKLIVVTTTERLH